MQRNVALLLALLVVACQPDDPTRPGADSDAPAPAASVADAEPTETHIVVFTTEGEVPADFTSTVVSLGGTTGVVMEGPGVASVYGLSDSDAQALALLDGVESVTRDVKLGWLPDPVTGDTVSAEHDPHDPETVPWWDDQWGLHQIEADQAWATGETGTRDVTVAILDTGIDYGHRELVGIVDTARSRSFVEDDPVEPGDHPVMDYHYHGTHVAGIVAAKAYRVSGVSPHITLIGMKVLSFEGSGTFEGVMGGIHAAGSLPVDVINMSLGAIVDRDDPEIRELAKALDRTIKYAEKQGTIVISAAGNDGLDLNDDGIMSTPCEQSTLCVTATGPIDQQDFDQPASYTNYGKKVIDIAAPGGNAPADATSDEGQVEDYILSACSRKTLQPNLSPCRIPGRTWYAWAAGTSMASPHVAGVAALIDSKYGGALDAAQLRSRVLQGAEDLGESGNDDFYGHGRLNAYQTVLK